MGELTDYVNISGVTQSVTDFGITRILEGADAEEIQTYAAMGQYLATLGQAIANKDWPLVTDLANGVVSSDEAAREFGWL